MWKLCLEFAKRQSRDEVQRQFGVINRMEARRRLLAVLPFIIAMLFLPVWICVTLGVASAWLEVAGIRILGQVDPPREPDRYLLALGHFAASQVAYMLIAALVWQDPDPFAKAFALGMFLLNLVHLATVRTVHYPLALISLAPATLICLMANTWYWANATSWTGLGISTLCIIAMAYFVQTTMTTVHQLHQEMFRDRQAAEGANEAKSRFLAQMSHELRTPLNAILGMGVAEMTLTTSAAARERLTTMVQSARSLSVLLNDILDLSAVQAGQLPIRLSNVDLRAEIGATLALFRQQVSDAGLTMTVAIDDQVPAVARIDGQRLRQCLSNVLSNAIKYTGQGAITVAVRLPDPGRIAIEVADTGPGVAAALRERIFEPFQRGETQVTGTGLGLSISRTLARRMGGDLVLLPGDQGARFLLTFALQPADPGQSVAPEPQALADLTGKRVLVVDDIATNRLVAITYLRILGATPLEVGSGEDALALLAREVPDVVLLDMLMPGLDGMTSFARIRALPGAAGQVPVIAMTADATEGHRRLYLDAGLNGYVSKPLSPEALSAALVTALAPARG